MNMNTATENQLYFEDSNHEFDLSKNADGHYLNEVARYAWMNWMTAYSFGRQHQANIANKAIEIALAEQQETYISAEEAARLGSGNVEMLLSTGEWFVIHGYYLYPSWEKYRAVKQAQPEPVPFPLPAHDRAKLKAQQAKTEPVDPHAAIRAEYIRQRDAVPCERWFYKWEFQNNLTIDWLNCGSAPEFCKERKYRCTDISCYVSKDGEPAIRMLLTNAQKLQAELGDTVEWSWGSGGAFGGVVCAVDEFSFTGGTYTYRAKPAKVVKWSSLPVGVMTNHGIFHGVFDGRGMAKRQGELPQYILLHELTLAPAADQPWIAVQDEPMHVVLESLRDAGLDYKFAANVFKITGLAEGYVLGGAV
jgi:hypothetical protein